MIPRVPFTSWVKVPSNSRTCLGPKRFLYLLHWPITRTEDDFKLQTPLKSIPLSFGPPQTATSNENLRKLWATISSNCRPNSCLVVDAYDLRKRPCGKVQIPCKIADWCKIRLGSGFIFRCTVKVWGNAASKCYTWALSSGAKWPSCPVSPRNGNAPGKIELVRCAWRSANTPHASRKEK